MKKLYYTFIFLLFMGGGSLFAQTKATKKADKYYNRLQFVKAAEKYEKLVDRGKGDAYIYRHLADSYYNLYNTEKAANYYGKYFQEATQPEADAYYRYSQMLKANKKYDKANEAMRHFAEKSPNDERAQAFLNNQDYISGILNEQPRFKVTPLKELNSEMSDFGGFILNDELYFVSSRNKSRRNYGWNGQPTLDVFVAEKVDDTYKNAEQIEGDVNSKFNEGTVCITSDGETLYFTRNDYFDGDYNEDSKGIGQLKIYKASLINGEWDDIQSVPFNDSEFSTGHPALSPDDKTLYFSSDRPGGEGMSDIYKVSILEDGSFGEPMNLGSNVNTPGRENFPFIDQEGTLYFSSDGQLGIGGLDVFYAENQGTSFAQPKNMGKPVNSAGDDFAFYYYLNEKEGFVSSNRGSQEGTLANDNIYLVEDIIVEKIDILVTVMNAETGAPIADAEVVNYLDENQVGKKMTSEDGETQFKKLLAGKDYSLQVNKDEYESNSKMISKDEEDQVEVVIELTPIEPIIVEDEIVLKPIKFDFDKADIRPKAAFELDSLVGVLKKHPDMEIKVEAHTDKRGAKAYNQQLSERRAKSTVEYIVSKGIDKDRLSSEAFGESKPKVDCSSCTEEQFQENRRSVFKITKR